MILDCHFGPISQPAQLAAQMSERAGIIEHGLFLGLVTDVIVASDQGIRHLKRDTPSPVLSPSTSLRINSVEGLSKGGEHNDRD